MNLETHISDQLWDAIGDAYQVGNFSHAVLEALHFVTETLRQKSGIDADGVALVGQALGETLQSSVSMLFKQKRKRTPNAASNRYFAVSTRESGTREAMNSSRTRRQTLMQLSSLSITFSESSTHRKRFLQSTVFCKV
jgi:hypothetical protein